MDAGAVRRKRRREWGRLGFGFVGAVANALGMVATVVGALAQAIRDQEHAPSYSFAVHLAHVLFNAGAMYVLLQRLGNEDEDARVTVLLWAGSTAVVWFAYWSWVL